MHRQANAGACLLLEGRTDALIFERFIDKETCFVTISHSKDNSIGALDLLEDEGFEGILCIVDADFDRLDENIYDLDNLVVTEFHDMEIVIFMSRALEVFLLNRAEADKLAGQEKATGKDIRQRILESASELGYCRWANERRGWDLNFKDLDFVFIDELSLISLPRIYRTVSENSPGATCNENQLQEEVAFLKTRSQDLQQICCGHDVATILGISLRRIFSRLKEAQTWRSEVEAGLRLAFDREAFQETNLYEAVRGWEGMNLGYRVLRV